VLAVLVQQVAQTVLKEVPQVLVPQVQRRAVAVVEP
jgi:hypothetical protein